MSKWRERYKVHPAADVFPMMAGDELADLAEDIKNYGLREPIKIRGDELLDGRNRLEAAERVGYGLTGTDINHLPAVDAVDFIISANIRRRHLTKQQQADLIVAAHKAAADKPRHAGEVSVGGRGKVNPVKAAAIATAKQHGISKRTVERSIANYERATDHPNAPPRLRAKARRQKKRETLQHYHELLATLPRTVEGARRFYLTIVSHHAVDVAAEMTAVVDGLQRIADLPEAERLKRRAAK